ncbi:MAG: 4-(cytidine 5'-diphospho)-2-C-methyl-D-erythritol kinase, partial [Actinomycetota bacterium]|nr:4-(cytidine 5'-diphospho)-2-C-methyl-D-erythritol kinase [Actinomycetota bacterium]
MGESESVTEAAPAKLNPYLRVIRRRDDGFHDIETIVLPLDLADSFTVRALDWYRFELRVTGPRSGDVPTGDENLVVRAARALAASTGRRPGATIEIEKRVPV